MGFFLLLLLFFHTYFSLICHPKLSENDQGKHRFKKFDYNTFRLSKKEQSRKPVGIHKVES